MQGKLVPSICLPRGAHFVSDSERCRSLHVLLRAEVPTKKHNPVPRSNTLSPCHLPSHSMCVWHFATQLTPKIQMFKFRISQR